MKREAKRKATYSWVVEAKFNRETCGAFPQPACYRNWRTIYASAFEEGQGSYEVAPGDMLSRPRRMMKPTTFERLLEKVTRERWSSYYHFRFKNQYTRETIPFELFPELEYD